MKRPSMLRAMRHVVNYYPMKVSTGTLLATLTDLERKGYVARDAGGCWIPRARGIYWMLERCEGAYMKVLVRCRVCSNSMPVLLHHSDDDTNLECAYCHSPSAEVVDE